MFLDGLRTKRRPSRYWMPYESALEPLCLQQQIGVVSYFALASGFLTGKYRAPADAVKSARGKGIVETFLNERGFKILAALDD
jgi:aryl-alcohol dehydrogenase-like predicted oxidoreductase